MKQLKPLALAIGLTLVGIGSASAGPLSAALVNGANTLLDESRETYVDVNGNGNFDAGDVIYGYIRMSDAQPSGATFGNDTYGIFSQQVAAASSGDTVIFETTTAAGLTLQALTGDAFTTGGIAALYDASGGFPNDLVNVPATGATSMSDYINEIVTNGTLEFAAGVVTGNNFLQSVITGAATTLGVGVGSSNTAFLNALLDNNFTVANTTGALDVVYNNLPFVFNYQSIFNPIAVAFLPSQVGVTQGTVGGAQGSAVDPQPKTWLNNSVGAYVQCDNGAGGTAPCGFTDKNNFTVDVTRVPEPATLSLLGLGILGMAGATRRRKKQAA